MNILAQRIVTQQSHILVATDLTDGRYLIPHAIAHAQATSARVTILHVIFPINLVPDQAGYIPYVDLDTNDDEVQAEVAKMAQELTSQGIACDYIVKHGLVLDVIADTVGRDAVSELIIGTHGRRHLAQYVLGSVASELLTSIDVPIFAVGPHTAGSHIKPRKILYPVSLLNGCDHRVGYAVDLAKSYQAELTLLYVLESDVKDSVNPARTFEWAHNAVKALIPNSALRVSVRTVVTAGSLVEQIPIVASQIEADWIVMGVDGSAPFWSFADSTAYKVLASSICPVLTLRYEHSPKATSAEHDEKCLPILG